MAQIASQFLKRCKYTTTNVGGGLKEFHFAVFPDQGSWGLAVATGKDVAEARAKLVADMKFFDWVSEKVKSGWKLPDYESQAPRRKKVAWRQID